MDIFCPECASEHVDDFSSDYLEDESFLEDPCSGTDDSFFVCRVCGLPFFLEALISGEPTDPPW